MRYRLVLWVAFFATTCSAQEQVVDITTTHSISPTVPTPTPVAASVTRTEAGDADAPSAAPVPQMYPSAGPAPNHHHLRNALIGIAVGAVLLIVLATAAK